MDDADFNVDVVVAVAIDKMYMNDANFNFSVVVDNMDMGDVDFDVVAVFSLMIWICLMLKWLFSIPIAALFKIFYSY